jgi:predicted site-specific integrase-resolvase
MEHVDYLLTSEVARTLGVSAATVSGWVRLKKIHVLRTASGVRLFPAAEVERVRQARAARIVATTEPSDA